MRKLFFIALLPIISIAQQINSPLDSAAITKKIALSTNDTNKVRALLDYGDWWLSKNTDRAEKYYDQAGLLANQLAYKNGKYKYLYSKISLYQINGNSPKFLLAAKELYDTANKYGSDKYKISGLLIIGTAHDHLGDVHANLQYHIWAEQLANKTGLTLAYPQIPYNIGGALNQMGEPAKAVPYMQKSIDLCKTAKDDKYLCVSYYNMGTVQTSLERYTMANAYFDSGHSVGESIHYEQLSALCLIAAAKNYSLISQPQKGLVYANKGMQLAVKTDYYYAIMAVNLAKFKNYVALNDYHNALHFGDIGIKMAKEKNNEVFILEDLKFYADLQKKLGNHQLANEYLEQYHQIRDTIENNKTKYKIEQLEIQYQSEKKERQITDLLTVQQQQNKLIIYLISSLAIIGLIGFLAYRNVASSNKIAQQKLVQLQQEKQLLALSGILEGQELERSRMAKDLHDGLGGMLSGIKLNLSSMKGNMVIHENDALLFTKSIGQLDKAITEMRRVAHNMMPEALLKFGLGEAVQDYCDGINESHAVTIKYTQLGPTPVLEKSTQVILYRIIQELTNNALKHAAANNIFIQLTQHELGLTLTVEDDGIGFDTTQPAITKGAGLHNIQSRVDYLKGSLEIDSAHGKGTSVTIEIPVQK